MRPRERERGTRDTQTHTFFHLNVPGIFPSFIHFAFPDWINQKRKKIPNFQTTFSVYILDQWCFQQQKFNSIQFQFTFELFFSLSLFLYPPNNELVSWKFDLCPFHCVLFSIETYIIPKRFQWWWRERERENFKLIKFLLDYNWYDNMAENRKKNFTRIFFILFFAFCE